MGSSITASARNSRWNNAIILREWKCFYLRKWKYFTETTTIATWSETHVIETNQWILGILRGHVANAVDGIIPREICRQVQFSPTDFFVFSERIPNLAPQTPETSSRRPETKSSVFLVSLNSNWDFLFAWEKFARPFLAIFVLIGSGLCWTPYMRAEHK